MYKPNLALSNVQWLICHETKQNQSRHRITRRVNTLVKNQSICNIFYLNMSNQIVSSLA